ncbi:MAG: transposase, partial [Gemmatimonadota bacterium]
MAAPTSAEPAATHLAADGSAASPSPARNPRSPLPKYAPSFEALVRYALRPPIAQERLKLLADDLVRIELRRPFGDGTVAVDLDPLSLLCRLA